jgi:acetolactate synthase I/II/III large subunit
MECGVFFGPKETIHVTSEKAGAVVRGEVIGERSGAQIVWETLVRLGVQVVFGYPGGTIMPTHDAMLQYPVRHIRVRHEQGAAHMADGYARASGKVGVAMATSGPGATNLVTGIANAMLDSVPLVCITGQVGSALVGTDAFQEIDITGVTLPITKHNFLVRRPEHIQSAIRLAFYIARSGRPGPVVVDITKDAQVQKCNLVWKDAVRLPGYRPEYRVEEADVERALAMIREAKRPLLFCGHGVVRANANRELLAFVERADIPVASTLLGLGGFPASHPRALGMMGMHGEAWVNSAIQMADLIIALGMRFDDRVTGNLQTYAKGAKKIHVELDPAEINKNVKVDLPIIGDVKDFLAGLTPRVEKQDRKTWLAIIDSVHAAAQQRDILNLPDDGKLHVAQVIHDLWEITRGRALVVSDVGQHQMWEAQYYRHDFPRKLITSGGLGTMGFGLPAALGARVACPDDEIWVIVGDGGIQMTQAEFATAKQEGLKVNVAIMNNGYLGMVRQWQEFFYDKRYVATPMSSPDFVKLADAHGLFGQRVTQRSEVAAAVQKARDYPGTAIIDFQVDPEDCVYPMVPAGATLDDMIRRPVEDEE